MRFKIRTKLIIAFFVIIFLFVVAGGILVLYSANVIHNSVHKIKSIAEERAVIANLIFNMERVLMPGNDYIITGDKKYIDDFYKASGDVEKIMKEAELIVSNAEARKVVGDSRIAFQNIKEITQKIFEIPNPVGDKEAARLMEEMDYKWAYPSTERLYEQWKIYMEGYRNAVNTADRVRVHSWIIVIVGVFLLTAIGSFFALYYSRIFVRPLEIIHNGADAIAKGDFKVRLDIKTGDEIEQLSKAMNEMAKQLDALYLNMNEKIEEGIKKFSVITESANDAIIGISSPDVIHFWNKKAEEMFGYKIDEVVGKSVHDLVVPQKFREKAKGGLNNFYKTGQGPVIGKVVEVLGLRKDGTNFPVELSVSAVRIGEEWQAIGIIRDVTERKKAEEQVRESEERFRRLVEHSPDGIAVHSEGKLLYINPTGTSLLGFSDAKELIGRAIMDFLHPDYKEIVSERIRKVLNEEKDAPLSEEKLIRFDGSIIDVEVSGVSVTYSGKQAVLVHFRDTTGRKEMERFIIDSEEKYRGLFNNTTNAIVIFDSETLRFEDINMAALNLYGYTKEEFLLLTPLDVSAEVEKSREALQDGIADKLTHIPLRYHKKKDGTVFPIEIFTGTFISKGRKKGFASIVDLTEYKKAEDLLKNRLDELEQFRKVTIQRELRMEELKRKVKELERRLGSVE